MPSEGNGLRSDCEEQEEPVETQGGREIGGVWGSDTLKNKYCFTVTIVTTVTTVSIGLRTMYINVCFVCVTI